MTEVVPINHGALVVEQDGAEPDAWLFRWAGTVVGRIGYVVHDAKQRELSLRAIELESGDVDDDTVASLNAIYDALLEVTKLERIELRCGLADRTARTALAWSGATLEGSRRRVPHPESMGEADEAVYSVLRAERESEAEPVLADSDVVVRPATRSDLGGLYEIERSAFGVGYDAGHLRQFLDLFEGLVLIADAGGHSVGYLLQAPTYAQPSIAWILSMGVRREHQGLGFGTRLLGSGLQLLQSVGVRRVFLTVDPDSRRAVELYRRFGFETVDVIGHYFGPFEPRATLALTLSESTVDTDWGTRC